MSNKISKTSSIFLNSKTKKLLEENIFKLENHKKETKQAFEKIITDLKKAIEIEKKRIKKFESKNFYKKNKIKPVYDYYQEKEQLFKALENLYKNKEISEDEYKQFKSFFKRITFFIGPMTSEIKAKNGIICIVIVPNITIFSRIFNPFYFSMTYFFDVSQVKKIVYYLAYAHEYFEAEQGLYLYWNKKKETGRIFISNENDVFQVGNHYSLIVLAREALFLNQYKFLDGVNRLRNYRMKYEWKVIKEYTGIDFSKILTFQDLEKVEKKLLKIEPTIIKFENPFTSQEEKIEGIIAEYNKIKNQQFKNLITNINKKFKTIKSKIKFLI